MKMTKKVLGVLLALAMLVNVFAMFSFAAAPDSAVDLYLRTDKDSYKAGDTVTFTVSEQFIEAVGLARIGVTLPIAYDSTKIQFAKTGVYGNPATNFGLVAHQAGYDDAGASITWTDGALAMGDTIDEGNNWDSLVYLGLTDDGLTTFEAFEKTDIYSFQMVIAEDCPDGDYLVGLNKNSFALGAGYVNDSTMGGIYGEDEQYYGTTKNYSLDNAIATIHVGDATASSFIKDGGAQIRFRGIGSTGTVADYQGEFDVRTVATISQDDFVANFGTDENAIAKITDIGFVYATAANVPTFDLATAKAVAEGTASEGYVKKAVQSIQHAGDGEVYKFTCLIENIADADKEQTVNALAYVCFDGTYYYFDAAATVDFATLYERMPK